MIFCFGGLGKNGEERAGFGWKERRFLDVGVLGWIWWGNCESWSRDIEFRFGHKDLILD